jgi:single-strand DNA-binding protein
LADVARKKKKKGMQVYLEGKIRTHSWEDNGVKKYATDIIADTFQMLGAKANNEGAQEQSTQPFPTQEQSSTPTNAPTIESAEDDLPF